MSPWDYGFCLLSYCGYFVTYLTRSRNPISAFLEVFLYHSLFFRYLSCCATFCYTLVHCVKTASISSFARVISASLFMNTPSIPLFSSRCVPGGHSIPTPHKLYRLLLVSTSPLLLAATNFIFPGEQTAESRLWGNDSTLAITVLIKFWVHLGSYKCYWCLGYTCSWRGMGGGWYPWKFGDALFHFKGMADLKSQCHW